MNYTGQQGCDSRSEPCADCICERAVSDPPLNSLAMVTSPLNRDYHGEHPECDALGVEDTPGGLWSCGKCGAAWPTRSVLVIPVSMTGTPAGTDEADNA